MIIENLETKSYRNHPTRCLQPDSVPTSAEGDVLRLLMSSTERQRSCESKYSWGSHISHHQQHAFSQRLIHTYIHIYIVTLNRHVSLMACACISDWCQNGSWAYAVTLTIDNKKTAFSLPFIDL